MFHRIYRISRPVLYLLLVLLAIRLAMPYAVRMYVQRALSKLPDYRAEVGNVSIHLYRGAYSIAPLKFWKVDGKVETPFFSVQRLDLSVQWGAIFDGAFVGELDFARPVLNFVHGPSAAESQKSADNSSWKTALKALFPLKFNRLAMHDGEVHYRDFHSSPQVDVYLQDINLVGRNLSNSKKLSKTLVANISASARPQKSGLLNLILAIDPWADQPTFNLDVKLEKLHLVDINGLLQAYGNFDVEAGEASIYGEITASNNHFDGYVKPVFTDLKVWRWKSDNKSFVNYLWQGVVAAVIDIFKNQRHDQLAAKIPYSGSFDEPRPEILRAIGTVLYNGFVRALAPSLENSVAVRKDGTIKDEPASSKD